MLVGGVILTLMVQRLNNTARWAGYAMLLAGAMVTPLLASRAVSPESGLGDVLLALGAVVALLVGLSRTLGPGWVIWPFLLLYGLWACYAEPVWRLPAMIGVGIVFCELVNAATGRLIAPEILKWAGGTLLGIGCLLVTFGLIWTEPTEQFAGGRPAWLGNTDLILPSLIMWGFPWVGTVGVLIYLAGLQQISTDVYEAAELDGVGPVGKLFKIELPLIMTQVRINLILMTIGTLTGYEFFLILLGSDGGPGNVGMVPGLYMYKSAFVDSKFGFACALGMVLFVVILLLTIVYQKYVKVDK
ncbi:MAG: sugar ABC transporter permease [Planctomycetota bacterium]